jgi:hypothetical protein
VTDRRIERPTGRNVLDRLTPLVAGALLLAGACARSGEPAPRAASSPSTPPASASAGTPTQPAGPGKAITPANPSPVASPAPSPATRFPKTVTFGRIVFSVPQDWGIDAQGDTAFVGVLAGGLDDVALRVQRNFSGSIDSLRPTGCPREGDPPERALSVDTVETGFRPVGDRSAEYRLWRVTCATGGAREHRAWLLPTSKIAIYEQVHDSLSPEVVATAKVQ